MSSRKVTPRSLIHGVLDTNSVSKSTAKKSRSLRRRSLRKSISNATPGTLIKGVLQTSSISKQSPARERRVDPTPPPPPSSSRRAARASRRSSLSGQNPTPRGLIQGYLAATAAETPAVRVDRRSSRHDTTDEIVERGSYQGQFVQYISPDVETPQEILSQGGRRRGATKRQHQLAAATASFQAGVDRRVKEGLAQPSFSESTIASPTLHSIPEEAEAGQIARTSADEDPSSQSEDGDDGIVQLATQPQRPARTEAEDIPSQFEVPDTSLMSMSQYSRREVALAETIQIHPESPSREGTRSVDQSSQSEDEQPSNKRQKLTDQDDGNSADSLLSEDENAAATGDLDGQRSSKVVTLHSTRSSPRKRQFDKSVASDKRHSSELPITQRDIGEGSLMSEDEDAPAAEDQSRQSRSKVGTPISTRSKTGTPNSTRSSPRKKQVDNSVASDKRHFSELRVAQREFGQDSLMSEDEDPPAAEHPGRRSRNKISTPISTRRSSPRNKPVEEPGGHDIRHSMQSEQYVAPTNIESRRSEDGDPLPIRRSSPRKKQVEGNERSSMRASLGDIGVDDFMSEDPPAMEDPGTQRNSKIGTPHSRRSSPRKKQVAKSVGSDQRRSMNPKVDIASGESEMSQEENPSATEDSRDTAEQSERDNTEAAPSTRSSPRKRKLVGSKESNRRPSMHFETDRAPGGSAEDSMPSEDEGQSSKSQRELGEPNRETNVGIPQSTRKSSSSRMAEEEKDVRDGIFEESPGMADYLERSTESSSAEDIDEDEEGISDGYSPLVTPNMLSAGQQKTPAPKTPAAIRNQNKKTKTPTENSRRVPPPRKNKPKRNRTLPLSLTKSIFSHFCNGRVSRDAWDAIEDCTDEFFDRLCDDLARYSKHANRQTIQMEDVILLMKRQGHVTNMQSLHALIEKYLSMEYRRELIPCAQVSYAAKDLKADIIVDVATLTGAQGISTGKYHSAVLCNKEDWEQACCIAGRRSGDLVFPIVFSPELHFSEFASAVADMKNSVADRGNAQSSCAGLFIFSHLGFEFPGVWMHLDIAAPCYSGERATGFGVALLLSLFGKASHSTLLQAASPLGCSDEDEMVENATKKIRLI